jgi:hypothetical protein
MTFTDLLGLKKTIELKKTTPKAKGSKADLQKSKNTS